MKCGIIYDMVHEYAVLVLQNILKLVFFYICIFSPVQGWKNKRLVREHERGQKIFTPRTRTEHEQKNMRVLPSLLNRVLSNINFH